VPFPNIALAQHPAFRRSIRELEGFGVRLLFDPDAYPLPTPNLGPASRDLFPWQALREELAKLTASNSLDAFSLTAVNARQVPPVLPARHRMRRHTRRLGR
jgi:hypothetical protein